MSDLDEKLKSVLQESGKYVCYAGDPMRGGVDDATAIEQIEQAFIDDGWHKNACYATKEDVDHAMKFDYYTGQEWYDRFIAEIENQIPYTPSRDASIGDGRVLYTPSVREAAKKAAGIK